MSINCNQSKFLQFFKDHGEKVLSLTFFLGATAMAVLTGLGLVVIAL